MYDAIDAAVRWIATNEQTAAAGVALLGAVMLYGVLGDRFLGADDDFWTPFRRHVWPRLHSLGAKRGLYAEGTSTWAELAGTAYVDDLDTFERHLERMGYARNPLAAYKRAPVGWTSDGSWAKRYGYGTPLSKRLVAFAPRWYAPGAGYLTTVLGRLLGGLDDVLARRQRHLTLYARPTADQVDADVAIHVFAHDEPNSLNPLTAWRHYRPGGAWDADAGVSGFLDDVDMMDGPFAWSPADSDQRGADDF